MSGGMAGVGYGLSGFFDMRDRTLSARERDEDRAREVDMRSKLDPMKIREAELTLAELERQGRLGEFLDRAGIPERRAKAGIRQLETQADSGELALRQAREVYPYTVQRAGSEARLAAAKEPSAMRDIADYEAMRPDRNAATRAQYGYQTGMYDAAAGQQEAWAQWQDLQQQFDNAIAIAMQTQDPTAIVSAYNNLVNDGQTVQIKVMDEPASAVQTPYKRKKKIAVVTPNTVAQFGPQGMIYDDFNAFVQDTQKVFDQYLMQTQPSMGGAYGLGAYGYGGRNSMLNVPGIPGSGGSRYGNMNSGGTAEIMNNRYIEQALAQTDAGRNMNPGELTMLAMKLRKNGELMAPEVAAQESYIDLVQALIKAESARFRDPDLAKVQAQAAEIVSRIYGNQWMQQLPQVGPGGQQQGGTAPGGYDWRTRLSQTVGR